MNLKPILLALWANLVCLAVYAQVTYPVKGVVKNQKTGQPLTGVLVRLQTIESNMNITGATTLTDGSFQFDAPSGEYLLRLDLIGYNEFQKKIKLSTNNNFEFFLEFSSRKNSKLLLVDSLIFF